MKGFTLIELMIVVAITGILVAVAIPSYQDYTIRARVTEGLNLASAAKLSVAESVLSNNALPVNQTATGYNSPAATDNVESVVIAGQGIITITYTAKAGGGTMELRPTLTSNGDLTWSCTEGTLLAKYRPASCR